MQTRTNKIWLGMMVLLMGLGGASWAEDLGTVFSYQGRLETAGSPPLNDIYDFKFQVYDTDEVGTGTPIGDPMAEPNVPVTEGIFNVQLNPDSSGTDPNLFNGEVRYLEIAVRKTGSAESYYTISPRQRINAAPYAVTASSARWLRGRTSTEKVVYVDDVGNVGIGTTNPTAKLEVNGNIKTAGVYEDSSGNVGIGTTSPSAELEVNGTIVSQNIVYKTSNQHEADAGFHEDDDLYFYMKPNTRYQFEFNLFVYRENGHEIKYRLMAPYSVSHLEAHTQETVERPGTSDDAPYPADVFSARLTSTAFANYHYRNWGISSYATCKIWGTIENSQNNQNIRVQWGPVVKNTNYNPIVYKGSYVIYREIP